MNPNDKPANTPPPPPASATTALQLRQQAYMLQTGLTSARSEMAEAQEGITVKDAARILFKHKWLLLASIVLCIAAALVHGLTSTPVYRASAMIQIDRPPARIVDFNRNVDNQQDDDQLVLSTQYELLRSRALGERVVDELGLDPIRSKARVAGVVQGKSAVDERELQARDSIVNGFLAAIGVDPVRGSRLVRISVSHVNPNLAAKYANTIAQVFINMSMERRMQSSVYAKSFLEDQIRVTKARLEDSERALNAYAKDNAIMTLDNKSTEVNQAYSEYSAALSKVEQERLRAEATYKAALANPESATLVIESKAVQTYKDQKAKLEAEYVTNLAVFKPEFPKMVQLKTQINEIDNRIKAEVSIALASLKAQYDAAKQQEDSFRSRLKSSRADVLQTQDKSVDLNLLRRELDTNRQIYDSLLQRLKEVDVTSGMVSNNILVVDEAIVPLFPVSPNLYNNAAAGLIAGLMLGVALVLIKEHLDDSIKVADDVEGRLGIPLLGIIPRMPKKQTQGFMLAMQTVHEPRSSFAEAYRSMRTALQFSTASGAPRRIMVTSSIQSEGKSTTALSLAINYAQMGQRVLIVDADMRNPSLHRSLGRINDAGLSSYLAGDGRTDALIQKTDIPNLSVLTAGPHPPSPADLLMGPRLLELLDRVEAMGVDKIVIDAPPILGIADSIVLGNQIHNILFAIRAGETRLSNIRDALRRLRIGGLYPLGVVLTGAGPEASQYYGYYYYGYGGVYGAENAQHLKGEALIDATAGGDPKPAAGRD
jgi:capsular exopolysaccharide synthesis family protein